MTEKSWKDYPDLQGCNCENSDCDHGKGAAMQRCTRPAGKGRVDWLGPVCDHCCTVYDSYNKNYVRVDINGNKKEYV